ncbi:MAG: siphovirus Gp157 family protein [Clostridium sp.]|nr:siphovirus Gp157 family protein [Clostridium sp.]
MNLYAINDLITQAFESAVDMETGEIVNADAYEALDSLQMAFDQKAEGILLWIKNLTAEAEALKKEKLAFSERQAAAERKAESLKKYISGVLCGNKFQTEKVSVTWRKSEAVEYAGNVYDLPEELLKYKEPEINKTELKKRLKAGEVIAGAELVQRNNMQIK